MDKNANLKLYDEEYFKKRIPYELKEQRLDRFLRLILAHRPLSVLDIGCGNGFLVGALLKKGINACGLDFSEYAGREIEGNFFIQADATKPLPFEDKTFDIVFSADFFEHINEQSIDSVLSEMKRVGKKVMAAIGYKPEKPYHLTVHKYAWWKKKLPDVEILNKTYGKFY